MEKRKLEASTILIILPVLQIISCNAYLPALYVMRIKDICRNSLDV